MIVTRDRYKFGQFHYLIPSTGAVGSYTANSSGSIPGGGGAGNLYVPSGGGETLMQLPTDPHLFWATETFNPFIQPDTGVSKYVSFVPMALGSGSESYKLFIAGARFYKTQLLFSLIHVANVTCSDPIYLTNLPGGAHVGAVQYTDDGTPPTAFLRDQVRISFSKPITVVIDTLGYPLLGFYANSDKARILITQL